MGAFVVEAGRKVAQRPGDIGVRVAMRAALDGERLAEEGLGLAWPGSGVSRLRAKLA